MFSAILIAALAASAARPAATPDVGAGVPIPQAAPASRGEDTAFAALERRIRERIARDSGVEVSVALIETGGARRRLGIADTVTMHAASTMKVPIMLEMFRQADRGRFSVDHPVRARNTFASIADGSPFTLASDRDRGLIDSLGLTMPMRRIAHSMITQSSNLATNIMIEEVSADSVQKTMRLIGADGMRVLRGVSDDVAFSKGINNTTTAAALARVMEVIARCDPGPAVPPPRTDTGVLRRDVPDTLGATISHAHSGRRSRRHPRWQQDRQHHADLARCRHRATARAGRLRAGGAHARLFERRGERADGQRYLAHRVGRARWVRRGTACLLAASGRPRRIVRREREVGVGK
jgi:hypothetical protein